MSHEVMIPRSAADGQNVNSRKADEVFTEDGGLFKLRNAYRFRLQEDGIREWADDPTAGRNPPYGASLSYWLKAERPEGSVELIIEDLSGRKVATLEGPTNRGINRVTWDLR